MLGIVIAIIVTAGMGYLGVARVAEFFNQKISVLDWKVKPHYFNPKVGPCVEIVNSDKDIYEVLFMGHMDTVFIRNVHLW
jgi:acetylornithine deacetylase/succinyl-diaminopimelate desuccinylase-like protein